MRQLGFLEWKDIDFKHSIINVNRSSLYLPEKGIFTDCKNRHPSPICTQFEHHFHALKPHLLYHSF